MSDWVARAEELVTEGRPDQALALLDEVVDLSPSFYEAKSRALCALGRFTDAEGMARLAGEAGSDPYTVNYLTAWARFGRWDTQGALDAISRIQTDTPQSVELTFQILTTRRNQKELRAWLAARRSSSEATDPRLLQAIAFYLTRDKEARRELEGAFAVGDHFAGRLLGFVYASHLRYERAAKVWDVVLATEPHNFDLLRDAAWAHLYRRNWATAWNYAERAARLRPCAAEPVALRIALLGKEGKRSEALAEGNAHWPSFQTDRQFARVYSRLLFRSLRFRQWWIVRSQHRQAMEAHPNA